MARLPGLSPFREDRPHPTGSVDPERLSLDVRQPESPRLRPVAAPVDPYARPAMDKNAGSGLIQLAQALGQLSPTVAKFGQVMQAEKEQKDKDIGGRHAARYAGDTAAMAKALQDGSDPELRDEVYRRYHMSQLAAGEATKLYERLQQERLEFPNKEDPAAWQAHVQGRKKELMEKYGNDPVFAGTFERGFRNFEFGMSQHAVKDAMDAKVAKDQQTIQTGMDHALQSGIASGAPATDIVKAIHSSYATNKLFTGQPFHKQDELLVERANALAQAMMTDETIRKDPVKAQKYREVLHALLNTPRVGADGQEIPALINSASVKSQASKLYNAVEDTYRLITRDHSLDAEEEIQDLARNGKLHLPEGRAKLEEVTKRLPGMMTQDKQLALINASKTAQERIDAANLKAAVDRDVSVQEDNVIRTAYDMITKGEGHLITDVDLRHPETGEVVRTVKAKEIKEKISQIAMERAHRVEQSITDPAQREAVRKSNFDTQLNAWVGGAPVPDQVKNTLKTGATMAVNSRTARDGTVPKVAEDGYWYYQQMKAKHPGLLHSLLSNDEIAVYEAVDLTMGIEDSVPKAFAAVARARFEKPDERTEALHRDNLKEMKSRMDTIKSGVVSENSPWYWSKDVHNPQVLVDHSMKLYDHLLRTTNASPEVLMERVGKLMRSKYVVVGGTALLKDETTSNPLFEKAANHFIEEFSKKNGIDKNDIFLKPMGSSDTLQVYRRSTGMPVFVDSQDKFFDNIFEPADLMRFHQQQELDAKTQAEAAERSNRNFWGAVANPGEYLKSRVNTAPGDPSRQQTLDRLGDKQARETRKEEGRAEGIKNEIATQSRRSWGSGPEEDNLSPTERLRRNFRKSMGMPVPPLKPEGHSNQ